MSDSHHTDGDTHPGDADDLRLSALIKTHATRHRISPALAASVQAEIALAHAGKDPAATVQGWLQRRWRKGWQLVGAGFASGSLVTAALMLTLGASGPSPVPQSPAQLNAQPVGAAELVSAHVRSMMVDHLTDVTSTDKHTVKPWFQGRLDFAPPVENFASDGYPLVGGRLDYVSGQPAAALVYQRNSHLINAFVWLVSNATGEALATPAQLEALRGYNVVRWQDGSMRYALVSDLNAPELRALQQLWQARRAAAAASR